MKKLLAILVMVFALPVAAQDEERSLTAAFEALEAEDWATAMALVAPDDPVARDLVTWARLRAGQGSLAEYRRLAAARPDWPGLDRAHEALERLLPDAPREDVIAWFEGRTPKTAPGALALAAALGGAEGEAALIRFWLEEGLDAEGFDAVMAEHADLLQPHHPTRADMLLWRWRTEDAELLLPHLDEGQRALTLARIGYIRNAGDLDERLALVPARLRDHPGLHYDRFNWLADRGDWTEAVALMRARSSSAEALGTPWRWGSWRRILSRWQMREGNGAAAYELATKHFLTPQDRSYADLEWLAGYLALQYLNDPGAALEHFERFRAAVDGPISTGRAGYWLGRAYEAAGQAEAAQDAYALGANFQTSFYGLLSAEKLGLAMDPDIAGGESFPDWQEADFLSDDLFEAALMLLEADERGLAVLFFVELAKTLDREGTAQLGQLLLEMDEPFYTVLIAKTAVTQDVWVQDVYFPIHPMAERPMPVEPALALAIARQESEFRVDAGSAVGALGLMQLMPGTAQDMARETGVDYSRARLITDWEYNADLGAAYLAYLREEFGESPVLIAVGYNAGPGRVRSWVAERGDPRRDGLDVVDWIEHIPFRETRNYVMRVTEGLAVYRARLSGNTGPVLFTSLLEGAPPVIRPVARPEGLGELPVVRPEARP